jgi:hypothetical protein
MVWEGERKARKNREEREGREREERGRGEREGGERGEREREKRRGKGKGKVKGEVKGKEKGKGKGTKERTYPRDILCNLSVYFLSILCGQRDTVIASKAYICSFFCKITSFLVRHCNTHK